MNHQAQRAPTQAPQALPPGDANGPVYVVQSPTAQPRTPLAARFARTIVHALVILFGTHAIAPFLNTTRLGSAIVGVISAAYFIPWSVSVAAALNNDRPAAILLVTIIAITAWPDHLAGPALATITGIILGSTLRHAVIGGPQ